MGKYDSDYSENDKRIKHKNPKFRDYYDEEFNQQEEIEIHKRKKKLEKNSKRKKNPDHEWPAE